MAACESILEAFATAQVLTSAQHGHLAECPACAAVASADAHLRAAMKELALPEGFEARLAAGVSRHVRPPRRRAAVLALAVAGAGIATVAIMMRAQRAPTAIQPTPRPSAAGTAPAQPTREPLLREAPPPTPLAPAPEKRRVRPQVRRRAQLDRAQLDEDARAPMVGAPAQPKPALPEEAAPEAAPPQRDRNLSIPPIEMATGRAVDHDAHFQSVDDLLTELLGSRRRLRLQGSEVTGPDLQVQIFAHEIRGSLYGHALELVADQDRISGTDGGSPVNLRVQRFAAGLRLTGTIHEIYGQLDIEPSAIKGRLGKRLWRMVARDGGHGLPRAGGVVASFSHQVRSLSVEQRLLLLVVLLSH
ncbi:MAG TPA: hypothetical protein VKN99_22350 [Polyangia bacterium]|nr:hypothetical protein [Polyangia bacterium]